MQSILKAVLPSWRELIAYLILGVLLLATFRFISVIELITAEDASDEVFSAVGSRIGDALSNLSAFDVSAPLSLAIFWSIVGVIVYALAVFLHNIWIEARNDLVVEATFMHPRDFKKQSFWQAFVLRAGVRLAAMIGILIFTIINIQVIFDWQLSAVDAWLDALAEPTKIVQVVLAAFSMMLVMHTYVVLMRLSLLRQRIFANR